MGNNQNKKVTDVNRGKETENKVSKNSQNIAKANADVDISTELKIKDMSNDAPIDAAKVSTIKDAIARGDYPVDLEKVADALLQAYSDIK